MSNAKQLKSSGVLPYFWEYLLYESIEILSENQELEFTASQGRKFHDDVLDELGPNGYNGKGISEVLKAIDTVAERDYDDYVFGGEVSAKNELYSELFENFLRTTGIPTKTGASFSTDSPMVPISPYDKDFAYRMGVMENGTSLLFVPGQSVLEHFDGDLSLIKNDVSKQSNLVLKKYNYAKGAYVDAGFLLSEDDKSGLSALAPFMKKSECIAVRDWMNSLPDNQKMTPDAIKRSRAILQYMNDNGIEYEVERDLERGQIRAKLTGTKINVRLSDKRDNESFVGRVYDNNAQIYYGTNYSTPGSGNKLDNYTPTAEEAVNILRFARGELIQNEAGETIGTIGSYQKYARSKQGVVEKIDNNNSYITGKDFVAAIKDYTKNGQVPSLGAKVNIRVKERASNVMRFASATDASMFLSNSIQEARENLGQRVQVDLLKQVAMDENAIMDYDTQSDIKALQGEILQGLRENPDFDANAAVESYLDVAVGHFERIDGKRFNPVGVANFMAGGYSYFRNIDNIIAASRVCGIEPDEVIDPSESSGVGRQLIKFDVTSAVKMSEHEDPFVRRMAEVIKTSIESNACEVNDSDILFDKNGVVSYTAYQQNSMRVQGPGTGKRVNGMIGQIFVPNKDGMVQTRFADTGNYLVAPGYEAYVVPDDGSNKTMEERTRLRGYEQLMTETLRYQLRSDLTQGVSNSDASREVGVPTNVNSVYRRLYGTRHDLDFYERTAEDGLSAEWRDAIIKSEIGRVKYSNELKEGSTINADYKAQQNMNEVDARNDNFKDPYQLSGRRNLSVLTSEVNGYFDPIMTGGATNQGIVRFLVEGAVVNPDGSITKSDDADRAPLMKLPDLQDMKYDPFDRQQMTVSNILQANSISDSVGVANITAGGWNFDDGIVVSSEFAFINKVRGADGQLRPLIAGDKLSDMHGNKGVISLVVDREASYAEYGPEKLDKITKLFKENPDLDIVMAPFPTVSRFNGGSTRELMKGARDLVLDGESVEGGMGTAKFIVTHMSVDAKTKVYDDEAMAEGRGRKASGQLAWALNSQGCDAIMREFYGSNNRGVQTYRDMLITMGLDMDETGHFREGYQPHQGEERNHFEMPQLEFKETQRGLIPDYKSSVNHFIKDIGENGGFMEIPFQLQYPTKQGIEPWDKDSTVGFQTYRLPVLSADIRSGREFADGEQVMLHDYTHHYANIMDMSLRYVEAKSKIDDPSLTKTQKEKYQKVLEDGPSTAQRYFNNITNDLEARRFSGKHNMIRDGIMANRLPNSATAVWLGDPRLPIDTVAVSGNICDKIGLKDGDATILWRDPMLRDAGVRAFKVKRDDNLVGIAINPVMDKSFDGDFDGDSIAVVKLSTPSAIREAKQKLSVAANLLDYGVKDKETGLHPLMMQDSLDMKVAQHNNPQMKEFFDDMTVKVNKFESDYKAGLIDDATVWQQRNAAVRVMSDYYVNGLDDAFGQGLIQYNDMESHLSSVEHTCIETGAKGSIGKMRHYMKHLGVTDGRPSGELDLSALVDKGDTLATTKDHNDTQYATAVKSFGTGIAGMFSQRGVSVLRNLSPKEVLELTYVATQSILQAKHDPIEARHKYEMLSGTARQFWQGWKMESNLPPGAEGREWHVAKDASGKPIRATKEEWIQSMKDFYADPNGLNVVINEDCIDIIADKLCGEDGFMMNLEGDAKEKLASPMDRLAYGGNFELVHQFAKEGLGLFDGVGNTQFAPRSIRENLQVLEQSKQTETEVQLKAIVKQDTKVKPEVVAHPAADEVVVSQPESEPVNATFIGPSLNEPLIPQQPRREVKDLISQTSHENDYDREP